LRTITDYFQQYLLRIIHDHEGCRMA